jgi:hypothetical protein
MVTTNHNHGILIVVTIVFFKKYMYPIPSTPSSRLIAERDLLEVDRRVIELGVDTLLQRDLA